MYDEFNKFGASAVPLDPECDDSNIALRGRPLLDEVFRLYGDIPASDLAEMTHSEPPWKATKINKENSHRILQD